MRIENTRDEIWDNERFERSTIRLFYYFIFDDDSQTTLCERETVKLFILKQVFFLTFHSYHHWSFSCFLSILHNDLNAYNLWIALYAGSRMTLYLPRTTATHQHASNRPLIYMHTREYTLICTRVRSSSSGAVESTCFVDNQRLSNA